jgi:hypothetical protein
MYVCDGKYPEMADKNGSNLKIKIIAFWMHIRTFKRGLTFSPYIDITVVYEIFKTASFYILLINGHRMLYLRHDNEGSHLASVQHGD